MVNFDTLASYALQRFYTSLDSGRLLTSFGVVRSFALAFGLENIKNKLDKLRTDFRNEVGVGIVDVMSLGLFGRDIELVFENEETNEKIVLSGYEVYKALYHFQLKLQELFDEALIASMKMSPSAEEMDIDKLFEGLGGVAEIDK